MPRPDRGRHSARNRTKRRVSHRAAHRRPRTHHLPTAVGTIAVATAAAGALTIGGPGAATSLAAGPSSATNSTNSIIAARAALSPAAAAAMAAARDQQRAERGTQRELIASAGKAVAVATEAADDSALDAMAADRLARFAPERLVLPVTGYRLSSMFGPRWGGFHTGMDMAVATGTPIYALAAGEIIFAAWDGPFGQKTVIRQDDGTEVWYCHQSKFALTSERVTAGELIGYVGSTGNTTGPHLHLEIHPNGGDAVDPKPWLAAHGLTV